MAPQSARLIIAGIAVAAIAVSGSASAQRVIQDSAAEAAALSLLGTIAVQNQPVFNSGRLIGCTIVYSALARDWAYKQGSLIKIDGNFGVMSVGSKLAITLKVVVHDFDAVTDTFSPSAPASAYFVSGTTTTKNAIVASKRSAPGALFVVEQFSPTFELLSKGLLADKVTIAFARRKGGIDILVPIDTSVVSTKPNGKRVRSPIAVPKFLKCAKSLGEQTLHN